MLKAVISAFYAIKSKVKVIRAVKDHISFKLKPNNSPYYYDAVSHTS